MQRSLTVLKASIHVFGESGYVYCMYDRDQGSFFRAMRKRIPSSQLKNAAGLRQTIGRQVVFKIQWHVLALLSQTMISIDLQRVSLPIAVVDMGT